MEFDTPISRGTFQNNLYSTELERTETYEITETPKSEKLWHMFSISF